MINLNKAIKCTCCGNYVEIPCTEEEFDRAITRGDKSIQTVLPNVSADYREMFISGICPNCWDKMFAEEEENA